MSGKVWSFLSLEADLSLVHIAAYSRPPGNEPWEMGYDVPELWWYYLHLFTLHWQTEIQAMPARSLQIHCLENLDVFGTSDKADPKMYHGLSGCLVSEYLNVCSCCGLGNMTHSMFCTCSLIDLADMDIHRSRIALTILLFEHTFGEQVGVCSQALQSSCVRLSTICIVTVTSWALSRSVTDTLSVLSIVLTYLSRLYLNYLKFR